MHESRRTSKRFIRDGSRMRARAIAHARTATTSSNARAAASAMLCRCPMRPRSKRAYREDYYADEKPTFLAHAGEDQAWAELAQTDRLEIFERLLPPDRRRLLDIGCGPGFFLQDRQGARLAGAWASSRPARRRPMRARLARSSHRRFFNDGQRAPALGRFDAIHLNNVLEHVPDPAPMLRLARDLLESGGVICVNVPNDFSPFQIAAARRGGARRIGGWRRRIISTISTSTRSRNLLERLGLPRCRAHHQLSHGSFSC